MTVRRIFKIAIGVVAIVIVLPALVLSIPIIYLSFVYRTNGSINVGATERDYLLYVPPTLDRAKPAPLVISLHGAMNWPGFQMKITRWNRIAEREGFLVVYPAGTGAGPRTWEMNGWGNPPRMPDVRFIAALIDKLQAQYKIDATRIYADGLSNGGGMAFVLSCTLANRIAAVGAVAAAHLLPSTWCRDRTPVPVIAFHGTGDGVVPYEGGKVWIAPVPFQSIPQFTAAWAKRNRCSVVTESAAAPNVTRTQYSSCAENADVALYTVRGGGHQWPGGEPVPRWLATEMSLFGLPIGPYTDSVNATELEWAFFRAHPLAREPRY